MSIQSNLLCFFSCDCSHFSNQRENFTVCKSSSLLQSVCELQTLFKVHPNWKLFTCISSIFLYSRRNRKLILWLRPQKAWPNFGGRGGRNPCCNTEFITFSPWAQVSKSALCLSELLVGLQSLDTKAIFEIFKLQMQFFAFIFELIMEIIYGNTITKHSRNANF